jgi:hypothetical protein
MAVIDIFQRQKPLFKGFKSKELSDEELAQMHIIKSMAFL